MINANYSINRLNAHELYNLAEFVVSENNESHICGSMSAAEQMKSVHSIHKEESTYYNDSIVYAVRNRYNSISGTIRTLKWNYSDELPIETIFGICPFQIMRQFQKSEVWHIGRFAISKNIRQIKLFKKLVMHAIQPNTKENKIKDFVDTLDTTNEMNDKAFVSLSGAGLASAMDEVEKNKHNTNCCNDKKEQVF